MPQIPLVLLVLLVVLVLAALVWRGRQAPGSGAAGPAEDLGGAVVVAVARPATAIPLTRVATALARPAHGTVMPMTILRPADDTEARRRAEATVDRCEVAIVEDGLTADGHVRVDASMADGILHGLVEREASALVVGWPTWVDGRFSEPFETLVADAPSPVLLARLDGYRWHRIVLRVPQEPLSEGMRASLRAATTSAERLATATGLEVVCVPSDSPLGHGTDQLVISPVAPAPAAIRRAEQAARYAGDVVLVLCHGARATERRPLLPTAVALYDGETNPALARDHKV